LPGETRMRVRIIWTGTLEPCGTTSYGEVEDYTINVQGWLNIDPLAGSVMPGDTNYVDINFDSHNMEAGLYTATAIITSNDPDAVTVDVDISLLISSMLVEMSTDNESICFGDETTITTEVYGSGETYTYSWSSIPEGFESEDPEVTVMPEVPTWYFVTVEDNLGNNVLDSLFIDVHELPIVELGDNTTVCSDVVWTLDAGNEGSTYLWSTGETSQTIVATGDGETMFWAEVTNENGCSSADTIYLDFVAVPEINLGDDTNVCSNIEWILDAGNEGSTYLWSTGETSQTIVATGDGETMFSVDVTNESGCSATDTVYLNFVAVPEVNLGADTAVCGSTNITLDAGNSGSTYLWSNGETTQTIVVDTLGHGYGVQDIMVEVTNENGCITDGLIAIDFINCTGINELNSVVVNIYPNPSNGIYNLIFNSNKNVDVQLLVVSNTGSVVYHNNNLSLKGETNLRIDISNNASGTYQLIIKGKTGIINKKLIIK